MLNERSITRPEKTVASRSEKKGHITQHRRKQMLDVFSGKGHGEATIPDIAREDGVAAGTIYSYYPSKRDILVSILAEPFLKVMEEAPEADGKAFFRALVQDRLTMLAENADHFLLMVGEVHRDLDLRQQWTRELVPPAFRRAGRWVQSRVDSGAFRPTRTPITVRAPAGMALTEVRTIEGAPAKE